MTDPADDRPWHPWTLRQTPPLVPEIALNLAADPLGIWQTAEEAGARQPFWAFAWPAGIALARLFLDRPALVAGKRLLDIGAGCGIAAIAAGKAGAAHVEANDIDPLAVRAIAGNAEWNGVDIAVTDDDVLHGDGSIARVDVIVIGDVCYEPHLREAAAIFLDAAARRGTTILFSDRLATPRPPIPLELIATAQATVLPELKIGYLETAGVWACNLDAAPAGTVAAVRDPLALLP